MKNLTKLKRLAAAGVAVLTLFMTACEESESSSGKTSDDSSAATTTTTAAEGDVTTTAPITTTEPVTTTEEKIVTDSPDDPEQPPVNAEPSSITPAMWKIETDSGNTIYMLGSMHALPEDVYPLPDKIMEIYKNADAVAFECDVNKMYEDADLLSEYYEMMLITDGSSVKDRLGEELYNAAVERLKEWNIYYSTYDYMHPAIWTSLIEEYIASEAGMDSSSGIDYYFLELTKGEGKELIELEDLMEDQIKMLFGFSDEIYKLMLESYIDYDDEELIEQYSQLYESWASGDVEALVEEDTSDMSKEELELYNEYNKALLIDRNVGMADAIEDLCDDGKDIFLMVGAAHFPGEDGILSLLDEKGIEYERVSYDE